MGLVKTELFTELENDLAQLAKVFSHPARIAIINYLLKSDSCINGELVLEIGLAQATISQHLKELKNSGIIQGTIEGVSMSYCINPERWSETKKLFNRMFDQYKGLKAPECC